MKEQRKAWRQLGLSKLRSPQIPPHVLLAIIRSLEKLMMVTAKQGNDNHGDDNDNDDDNDDDHDHRTTDSITS